jgi:hypothetical protein
VVTPPARTSSGYDRLRNLPVDAEYDEEEMPTVIVSQPSLIPRKAAAAPRSAGKRTSGATIIAFDDEDDED